MKNHFHSILSVPGRLFSAFLALIFDCTLAEAHFGVSYPEINVQTAAQLAVANANVREVAWAINMIYGSDSNYDECPFAGRMIGRISAKERPDNNELRRCVVEVSDFSKLWGNTVNVPLVAGVGGEGVSGDNTRRGSEAVLMTDNFQVLIGKQFFSVGQAQTGIDETILGRDAKWNKTINTALRMLHNRKKSNTIQQTMVVNALANQVTGALPRNLMYPSGVTAPAGNNADGNPYSVRDGILSTNVVNTPLITKMGNFLSSLGGAPMSYATDDAGSNQECFLLFGGNLAFANLATEPALLAGRQFAADRGKDNRIFAGGFEMWNGHGIYQQLIRDHANPLSIGTVQFPRARLGGSVATAAGTLPLAQQTAINLSTVSGGTNFNLYGGGYARWAIAAAYAVEPNWFEHWSGAQYNPYGFAPGTGLFAAVTTVTRYLCIITGSTYGYYTYKVISGTGVNNANAAYVTITGKYTGINGSLPEANQVRIHNVGDLMVEVNAIGVSFCRTFGLGCQAIAAGVGRIGGSEVNPEIAKFVTDVQDYEVNKGVGAEAVWGCAPVKRALDGVFPNFVVIETAYNADDCLPVVTAHP